MANIKEELELHKKMINYYVDLINQNENISNLKLLLQEIENLHNIILKEYINHLSIALNTAESESKNISFETMSTEDLDAIYATLARGIQNGEIPQEMKDIEKEMQRRYNEFYEKQEIEINKKQNDNINDINTQIEETVDEVHDYNPPIDNLINDITNDQDEFAEKSKEKTEPNLINSEELPLDFNITNKNEEKDKIDQDKNKQAESFINEITQEQEESTKNYNEKTESTLINSEKLSLDFDITNKNEEHSNNLETQTKEKQTILESFINEADNDYETINNPPIINNKIDDLHKAFSISDRYFITNKLFNNNSVAFSMAIESINQCATIEQVNIILKELQNKYHWDIKSYEYNYFYSIIQQKFN
ncbi:MAG: hypothetical protein PWQ14_996 [Rikenellaceae bacterium]|jgi:DNA polymerase III alpha subunit (gram-positive type)|nr:hypothetical protein [Rikenellaceae bacterium]